jgi:alkylhydroperoxidase family enzyme
LRVLKKFTAGPDELSADDFSRARDAGVSDYDMEDALHVAFAFNTINRIADALGFDIPDAAGFQKSANMLLRFGYKV